MLGTFIDRLTHAVDPAREALVPILSEPTVLFSWVVAVGVTEGMSDPTGAN